MIWWNSYDEHLKGIKSHWVAYSRKAVAGGIAEIQQKIDEAEEANLRNERHDTFVLMIDLLFHCFHKHSDSLRIYHSH